MSIRVRNNNNTFYGKGGNPSKLGTLPAIVEHPENTTIYILNDGSNKSVTLSTTFLNRVFMRWFVPRFRASSTGEDTSASRLTITDISVFNNWRKFRKVRAPIFKSLSWQVSTDSGNTYSNIDTGVDLYDANTWLLKLDNLSPADNTKKYRLFVEMEDYTLISKPATITMSYLPGVGPPNISINTQPLDVLAIDGSATFTVDASDTTNPSAPLTYVWRESDNNGFSFKDIPNSNSYSLSLTGLTRKDHNKQYQVKISAAGSEDVFSVTVKLLTMVEIDIVNHPKSTIAVNNQAQFFVTTRPANKISFSATNYQWQVSKDNGLSYVNISGATNSVLNLSNLNINDHNSLYRVVVSTSSVGTEDFVRFSEPATLYTVESSIVFETQPLDIATIEASTTFYTKVRNLCTNNCGSILYQWAYVTGTENNPIYTAIQDATLDYLTVNVVDNDKKKFALIASQPNTNSVIISNTVTLTNLNNKPTDIFLSNTSVLEGNNSTATIGTLSTQDTDAGGSYTYSLVGDFTDNASFSIENSNLKANNTVFNYNTKSSYTIGIRSTDQAGLFIDKLFTIKVRKNITLTLTNTVPSILETTVTTNGVKVADLLINHPLENRFMLPTDDLLLLGANALLLSGADANSFEIKDLQLFLKAGTVINNAPVVGGLWKSSYSTNVELVPEFGTTSSKSYTLTIINVNDAPSNVVLSPGAITEGNFIGAVVGIFTTIDPDPNQTHTYTFTGGAGDAGNSLFSIEGNILRANTIFYRSIATSHNIRIASTDSSGASIDKVFTISVLTNPFLTPTPTPTPSSTPSASPTPSITPTTTHTPTGSITRTPTSTITPTPSRTPSSTPTPTPTPAQPPQQPKPPDSVSGDPHYYITSRKGIRSIIDDNIGGDPVIAAYIKIYDEEWKVVITNTAGIVCSIESMVFYYRKSGDSWTTINRQNFNKNGCFIVVSQPSNTNRAAQFYWNSPEVIAQYSDVIVGGFLYWLQKAVEISDQEINSYWPTRKGFNASVGIDGITEAVQQFNLHRNNFLASHGDSRLYKITEKFNMYSRTVTK